MSEECRRQEMLMFIIEQEISMRGKKMYRCKTLKELISRSKCRDESTTIGMFQMRNMKQRTHPLNPARKEFMFQYKNHIVSSDSFQALRHFDTDILAEKSVSPPRVNAEAFHTIFMKSLNDVLKRDQYVQEIANDETLNKDNWLDKNLVIWGCTGHAAIEPYRYRDGAKFGVTHWVFTKGRWMCIRPIDGSPKVALEKFLSQEDDTVLKCDVCQSKVKRVAYCGSCGISVCVDCKYRCEHPTK